MKDAEIEKTVLSVKQDLDRINDQITELHNKGVEVRIMYKESTSSSAPSLELWKVIEHVDYLK